MGRTYCLVMNIADVPTKSLSAVRDRNKEAWLALFTDDAVVQDPVGPAEWDPEGLGQRGKPAIAAFYDMFSARQKAFDFEIHHQVAIGNEVACYLTLRSTLADDTVSAVQPINLYEINDEGLIVSLRSFWTR